MASGERAAQRPSVQVPPRQAEPLWHSWPAVHLGQPELSGPQSTSCSAPSSTRLSHLGAWHTPATHWPSHWSDVAQDTPAVQSEHRGPPQSPPGASSTCAMPSEQVGWAQKPPEHDRDAQSVPAEHRLPAGQRAHPESPPQSTPVSLPLRLPSLHDGRSHTRASGLHTPEPQSLSLSQPSKSAQGGQSGPPPSVHVSLPSVTWLKHDGSDAHAPPKHEPDRQSASALHRAPTGQPGQPTVAFPPPGADPQSTSLSAAGLNTPSSQLAAWHTPPLQAPPVAQSVSTRQVSPSWHMPAPASRSEQGSSPLVTPSERLGGAQSPGASTLGVLKAAPTDRHTPEVHCWEEAQWLKSSRPVALTSTAAEAPPPELGSSELAWQVPKRQTRPSLQSEAF